MSRPKIKVKNTWVDYLMEGVSIVSITITFVIFFVYWQKYPSDIPIHYNALGEIDSYGSKWILLILPIIGFLTYLGMSILNRYPYIFNYPIEVNELNAYSLYKIGKRTVLSLKMLICLLLLYISFAQVSSLIYNRVSVKLIIIILFILFITIIPIISALKMSKLKK